MNDSKLVYSSGGGLGELERSVLCLLRQTHGPAETLRDVLHQLQPSLNDRIARHAWYTEPAGETFPLVADRTAVAISSNALSADCARSGTKFVYFAADVLPEREFNKAVDRTRNKASVSFALVANHLHVLLRDFTDESLLIYCDRQGGRSHYGSLLRLMFEEWDLTIVKESDACSEYELRQSGRFARLIFCEKAEQQSLPVAAASMVAKYTREALMSRFNYYWKTHQADLLPTAGYYTDGWRFLRDIEPLRDRLGVADVDLIRQR